MGTKLANSESPDEMKHNITFHHGLHCLLTILKQQCGFTRTEKHQIFKKFTCDPLECTLGRP